MKIPQHKACSGLKGECRGNMRVGIKTLDGFKYDACNICGRIELSDGQDQEAFLANWTGERIRKMKLRFDRLCKKEAFGDLTKAEWNELNELTDARLVLAWVKGNGTKGVA